VEQIRLGMWFAHHAFWVNVGIDFMLLMPEWYFLEIAYSISTYHFLPASPWYTIRRVFIASFFDFDVQGHGYFFANLWRVNHSHSVEMMHTVTSP